MAALRPCRPPNLLDVIVQIMRGSHVPHAGNTWDIHAHPKGAGGKEEANPPFLGGHVSEDLIELLGL